MRILQLHFKNLNSLYGEWSIDFTNPDYLSNGIFLITGATGAGKTTIFDALCLALYGKTPRLPVISSNENEINSRGTGESHAEVVFETETGRYSSWWGQRRAKNRPDGRLQKPTQKLMKYDPVSNEGTTLSEKISVVQGMIENEIVRMSFEQFTRSMLLAQGQFNAFLNAKQDERSAILEQITGTEIYSEISIRSLRRYASENEITAKIRDEIGEIAFLSEEEISQSWEQFRDSRLEHRVNKRESRELRRAIALLREIDDLEKELAANQNRIDILEAEETAFAPNAARLKADSKAIPLQGEYSSILNLRTTQEKESAELNSVLEIIEKLQLNKIELSAEIVKQDEVLTRAKEHLLNLRPLIKETREIETRINSGKTEAERIEKKIEKRTEVIAETKKKIKNASEKLAKTEARLLELEQYRTDNSEDIQLLHSISGLRRQFKELASEQQALENSNKEHSEIEHESKITRKSALDLADEHKSNEEKLNSGRELGEDIQKQISEIGDGRSVSELSAELESGRELLAGLEQFKKSLEERNKAEERLKKITISIEKISGQLESVQKIIAESTVMTAKLEKIRELELLIAKYEDDRCKLEDGRPCPLCGADSHPFAEGNTPIAGETETELVSERKKLDASRNDELRLSKDKSVAEAELKNLEKIIFETKNTTEELSLKFPENGLVSEIEGISLEIEKAKTARTKILATLEELARLNTEAEKIRKANEKFDLAFLESGKRLQSVQVLYSGLDEKMKSSLERITAQKTKLEQLDNQLREDTTEYNLKADNPTGILEELETRREKWIANDNQYTTIQKQVSETKEECRLLQESLKNDAKALEELSVELDRARSEIEKLAQKRAEIFGDKDTAKEEAEAEKNLDQAEKAVKDSQITAAKIETELSQRNELCEKLRDSTAKRNLLLESAEFQWTENLQASEFSGEQDFLAAILDENQRKLLHEKQEAINKDLTETRAVYKKCADSLNKKREDITGKETLEELSAARSNFDSLARSNKKNFGDVVEKLRENRENTAKISERRNLLDIQLAEQKKWNGLYDLIGSGDGKKFRNFAQGLTFEAMVREANRQLAGMSDRYRLVRETSKPLELNVIDNDQGGEVRPTRNLSGGESFIVCLSLALGLSQLSSRNVRIDSLFLDEGFGTLDPETLETALQSLVSLQQRGKLIGIISHVELLKERIPSQINVTKKSAGRSVISGPGIGS